jgi:hypothetical protein
VPLLGRLVVGLPQRRPGFETRSGHVGFVVGKAALGQSFLRELRFPSPIIPLLQTHHHPGPVN